MDVDQEWEITIVSLPSIETSVRYASMRQIHAAIDHFHRGDFECAATLAAAGRGMLPVVDNAALPELEARLARVETVDHWLAHGTILDRSGKTGRRENIIIRTAEVVIAIQVAIARFEAAFPDQKPPQMVGFRLWAASIRDGRLEESRQVPPRT